MKIRLTIVATVIVVGLVGTFAFLKARRLQVAIPESAIASTLTEELVLTTTYLYHFKITVFNPQVAVLDEDDRVQVGLDVEIDLPPYDYAGDWRGKAVLTAGIRYDSQEREFFLDDIIVEQLETQGLPKKWRKEVAKGVLDVGGSCVRREALHTLPADWTEMFAGEFQLEDFEVREQAILVTLKH